MGSDDVLLGVLSALDGVWKSELTRTADGTETLAVRLPGDGNWAEVTRTPGSDEAVVHRYYTPDHDPNAKDDSVWTQQRQMQDASRRTTVRARVDDIVAAITNPRS